MRWDPTMAEEIPGRDARGLARARAAGMIQGVVWSAPLVLFVEMKEHCSCGPTEHDSPRCCIHKKSTFKRRVS